MTKFEKFLSKSGQYMTAKNLNEKYNLLNSEQKEKAKIAIKKYHQPVAIAIQQALFFGKIACDDINEYLKVNNMI